MIINSTYSKNKRLLQAFRFANKNYLASQRLDASRESAT